jgi:SAM-dependent methyltransferase
MRRLREFLAHSPLFAFNPVFRDRWVAQQADQVPAGTKVLDVGAGSPPYRQLFAHCDYRTQDFAQLDKDQLRYGGYSRIDYVGDATAIPVPDGEFDLILCTEMLEHTPEPMGVLHEFARIIKPGGQLLLTAPLGSGLHQEPYHFYGGFTPYWYEKFLTESGFEQLHVEPNGGFPRLFAQESIRFIRNTAPHGLPMPLLPRLLWTPAWLLLTPLLGLIIPLLGAWLDRYDNQPQFTVGYHVSALRKGKEG